MRVVAGRFRSRRLLAPPGRDTRPMLDRQKEALFNVLAPELPCDGVLDLFAGSGSLGLEALSRGARRVTFVERAAGALAALGRNVEELGVADEVEVVRADALALDPGRLRGPLDLVLCDPPFGLAERDPDALGALLGRLLAAPAAAPGALFVLRLPLRARWPAAPGGVEPAGAREWGESRVLLYRGKEAPDSDQGAQSSQPMPD